MALTGLAIAAALALAKNKMIDEPAAGRQRKLAAATQRLSPWTHLTAEAPKDPNAIGDVLQYGATGASMGSGIKNQQAQTDMYNRMGTDGIKGANLEAGAWGNLPQSVKTDSTMSDNIYDPRMKRFGSVV